VDFSSTLKAGDRAPAFTLRAANDSAEHTLSEVIATGPAVIEFLRGTW
jgi:peroxiredoxin